MPWMGEALVGIPVFVLEFDADCAALLGFGVEAEGGAVASDTRGLRIAITTCPSPRC